MRLLTFGGIGQVHASALCCSWTPAIEYDQSKHKMQDSRAVDEAMSVIGNYKGSSTKQKSVTGQLREIIFLNHGEQLVNFFSTSSRSTPSSLCDYQILKRLSS